MFPNLSKYRVPIKEMIDNPQKVSHKHIFCTVEILKNFMVNLVSSSSQFHLTEPVQVRITSCLTKLLKTFGDVLHCQVIYVY